MHSAHISQLFTINLLIANAAGVLAKAPNPHLTRPPDDPFIVPCRIHLPPGSQQFVVFQNYDTSSGFNLLEMILLIIDAYDTVGILPSNMNLANNLWSFQMPQRPKLNIECHSIRRQQQFDFTYGEINELLLMVRGDFVPRWQGPIPGFMMELRKAENFQEPETAGTCYFWKDNDDQRQGKGNETLARRREWLVEDA